MELGPRCYRHRPYQCAHGACVRTSAQCHSNRRCMSYPLNPRRYRCPEGNCVTNDYYCIRPCGFEQLDTTPDSPFIRHKYNYPCPHYPDKCGRNPSECPRSRCNYPDTYICPGTGQCKPNFHWCASCSEYRCDNGVCFYRMQKCDDINDCGDWSDEKYCDLSHDQHPIPATNTPDSLLQPWSIVMISCGVILLMLATVYIILRRYGPFCRRGQLSGQNSPQIRSSCTYANDPALCLWNSSIEGSRLSYIRPQDSPTSFILSRSARGDLRERPRNPPSYLDVMASEQYSPYPEDSFAPPTYYEAIQAATAQIRNITEPTMKTITTSVTSTQTSAQYPTETVV